jgi:hypothetical protein
MADQNITYKIIVDSEAGTATLRDLQGRIVANQVPLQELRKEFGNFAKTVNSADFNKFKQGLDSATKSNQNFTNASGSATSAVLELGRVVQDAPYGIRGMGNNITQLASQMAFATKDAGSFTAALGQMGKALIGPLGIVLAISAVVSVLDFLYGANKKAEKSTQDLGSSMGVAASNLRILKVALENNTISTEEANKSVNKANKEYKELNLKLDENNKLTTESVKRIDAKIESLQRLAKATAVQKMIEESYGKILSAQIKAEEQLAENGDVKLEEVLKKQEEFTKRFREVTEREGKKFSELTKEQQAEIYNGFDVSFNQAKIASEFDKTKKTVDKEIKSLIDILNSEDLFDELFKEKGNKGSSSKRDRAERLFNFPTPKEVLAYSKKLLDAVARGFGVDMKENPLSIKPELDFTLSDEAKARIDSYTKSVRDELILSMKLNDFAKVAELTKQALTSITDFTSAQFDRDLVIEQNKTTALNEELNNRLLNENLSKDERAKIQNEIAKNDESLRKKQNEIKKKQFNTQKAFNIASALVDTGRAAAGVMADAKGGFFTRLAQAIPTIAFGLAQVATIASQKFQPDSASTPIRTSGGGGSSGGMGDRSFNFNLVGNNRENQLANAIQGQFNQPLKAYVVSRDMSNQQQLDANIVNSARF